MKMKKVIIKDSNREKIEAILEEVQGKCTVRKINKEAIIANYEVFR